MLLEPSHFKSNVTEITEVALKIITIFKAPIRP